MTLTRMFGLLVGYVGARFLGAFIGLASQIIIARALPQAEVATVLMAMSAAAFISLFVIGGHAMLATTELPRLATLARARQIAAFHGATLWDALVALVFAAFVVGLMNVSNVFSGSLMLALGFGLASTPASGLLRYNSIIANSDRRFALSYVPDFLVRSGLFLVSVLVFWWFFKTIDGVTVMILFVATATAVALGQAILLGSNGLIPAHLSKQLPRLTRVVRRRAWALTLVSAFALASADIVTLIAGYLLPPDQVAIVGIAVRLAAIAGFVLQATQMFVLPDFSAAITRKAQGDVNAILWKVSMLTLAVIGAGLIVTWFAGGWVLGFFGSAYVSGAGLLILFLVGQSVRALGGLNQSLLSLKGFQMRSVTSCVLALLALVCAAVLYTPQYGALGLGYAVVLAEFVWAAGLAVQAQRLVGQRADLFWLMTKSMDKGAQGS